MIHIEHAFWFSISMEDSRRLERCNGTTELGEMQLPVFFITLKTSLVAILGSFWRPEALDISPLASKVAK